MEKTMQKQKPLWERLYFDAAYVEVARLIGYRGTTYRDMMIMLEPLEGQFGKVRVHSAVYHIVTFEGQMTCNPKPLADVKLRPEVRQLCFQLLGPAPEQMEAFMTNADGSSRNPNQEKPARQGTPPNAERKPVRNEASAKKARNKKAEPEKPVEIPAETPTETSAEGPAEASRPATGNSSIMDQYGAAKEKHPDMMLLFRIGDFYEMFDQDAEEASKLLGLTLTSRDQMHTMAGFPHHCLEKHLQKLLKAGKRVAICDQMEDSAGSIR
jgi:hypothetical protein